MAIDIELYFVWFLEVLCFFDLLLRDMIMRDVIRLPRHWWRQWRLYLLQAPAFYSVHTWLGFLRQQKRPRLASLLSCMYCLQMMQRTFFHCLRFLKFALEIHKGAQSVLMFILVDAGRQRTLNTIWRDSKGSWYAGRMLDCALDTKQG